MDAMDTITLAGKDYPFRQPKSVILISAMMQARTAQSDFDKAAIMIEAQAKWLRAGLGKDAWSEVEGRLQDDDDPIDWDDIATVFEAFTAQDAGRPSMSSSASSEPSQGTTSSEAELKTGGSIFGI